jgi:flagellar basal-body rod protein FlgF
MENALLVTLSRQITLQHKMDVIANNLANMNTAGYKGEAVKFEQYLMPVASVRTFQGADRRVDFVDDPRMVRDLSEGEVKQTGNELDVAIAGDGWLVVSTPGGDRYTRNGQLKISADGVLVTNEGYPVQGEGGQIAFAAEEKDIVIGKDGTISSSAGMKGRLQVVDFTSPQAMKKRGDSLYTSDETPQPARNAKIIQGSYENSNVQPMQELTQMIETVRAYESVTRMLTATDETRGQAIQQLGRAES